MPWKFRTCDAQTRKGTLCKNTRLFNNGRCKLHGGMSTGPKTLEGRLKALANLKNVRDKSTTENIKSKRPARVERRYMWVETTPAK